MANPSGGRISHKLSLMLVLALLLTLFAGVQVASAVAAEPSAEFKCTDITGTVGNALTPVEVTVTLTDGVFADAPLSTAVDDWFSGAPTNLSITAAARISDTVATLTVTGEIFTPQDALIVMSLASSLLNPDQAILTVTNTNSSKYVITAEAEIDPAIGGQVYYDTLQAALTAVGKETTTEYTVTLLNGVEPETSLEWPATNTSMITIDMNGKNIAMGDGAGVRVINLKDGNKLTILNRDQNSISTISGGSETNGGGINVVSGSELVLGAASGGKVVIGDNTASGKGGGVYNAGTFTMNDTATITGNTVTGTGEGAGVYNETTGTFTMTGGDITDNTFVKGNAGGVYNDGTFNISGAANITGNTETGAPANESNVYLADGKFITVTDAFTGSVGVTVETAPTEPAFTRVAVGSEDGKLTATEAAKFVEDTNPPYARYTVGGEASVIGSLDFCLVPTAAITDITIPEANGATQDVDITVTLTNTRFKDITLAPANADGWFINDSLPEGIHAATVASDGSDYVTITLSGVQTDDFDAKEIEIEIPITAAKIDDSLATTINEDATWVDAVMTVQHDPDSDSDIIPFATHADGWDEATGDSNAATTVVVLLDDWTADSEITVAYANTVNLKMNDCDITQTGDNAPVFTVAGTLVISEEGIISGGSASGVQVTGTGTFTLNDATIARNSAAIDGLGGGVLVGAAATFNMNSGLIADNSALNGGGVYVNGTFAMAGGEITDNFGSTNGGGVFFDGTVFKVSGNPKITGNRLDNEEGNVYLPTEKLITKSANLAAGANIRVYTEDALPADIVETATADDAKYFAGDFAGRVGFATDTLYLFDASAEISDVILTGTVNSPITSKTATITLTGCTFIDATAVGDDATPWFDNLAAGIEAEVTAVNAGKTEVTITFSGTPIEEKAGIMSIFIAETSINEIITGDDDLLVTRNPNARFKFAKSNPIGQVTPEPYNPPTEFWISVESKTVNFDGLAHGLKYTYNLPNGSPVITMTYYKDSFNGTAIVGEPVQPGVYYGMAVSGNYRGYGILTITNTGATPVPTAVPTATPVPIITPDPVITPEPTVGPIITPDPLTVYKYGKVRTDSIDVYDNPDGNVIMQLAKGTNVVIYRVMKVGDTTWAYIGRYGFNEQLGWVKNMGLTYTAQPVATPEPTIIPTVGPIITPEPTIVPTVGPIITPEPTEVPIPTAVPTPAPGTYALNDFVNNNNRLNIREKPSTDSKILGKVPVGEYIVVVEYGTEWTLGTYDNGTDFVDDDITGYMATRFLKFGTYDELKEYIESNMEALLVINPEYGQTTEVIVPEPQQPEYEPEEEVVPEVIDEVIEGDVLAEDIFE